MSLEAAVDTPKIFHRALSLFPAYVAEIEDCGSDSTGRFSEDLFAGRIADSRDTCEMHLDMYDADPVSF
ncbi:hypothetical protein GGI1_03993 [Acidithiobacillus sp. GGI-221]|nr:hypothetical protein GGI1_03993 [Acidithiobacillus sp. GGI-221]